MLIAEDLLLLLLDDEDGRLNKEADGLANTLLAGAVLMELASSGAAVSEGGDTRFSGATVVVGHRDVADPILLDALDVIERKQRSATSLLHHIQTKVKLRDRLLARLVEKGMIQEQSKKVMLVFDRSRWPAANATHETAVRTKIEHTLHLGSTADERTAALITLVSAIDKAAHFFPRDGIDAKDIKQHAEEVSDQGWASDAVRTTIAALARRTPTIQTGS